MALISSAQPNAYITYAIAGASLTGTANIGTLPVGYQILRASIKTNVAGTGSSSPTLAIGISGTTGKYVTSAALTVSAGVAALTVIGTAVPTADETLSVTYGGTTPTNATYAAVLVVELMRVGG